MKAILLNLCFALTLVFSLFACNAQESCATPPRPGGEPVPYPGTAICLRDVDNWNGNFALGAVPDGATCVVAHTPGGRWVLMNETVAALGDGWTLYTPGQVAPNGRTLEKGYYWGCRTRPARK